MKQLLGSVALWPLEQVLNQLISSDSYVAEQLAPFSGKDIEIITSSPRFNISLRFDSGQVRVSALDSTTLGIAADATLEGKAGDLLELLSLEASNRPLANPALRLSGDVQLINDLLHTLQALDIDWQDYLSPVLGDVITRQLGQFNDDARSWAQQANASLRRNIEDYLKEEKKVFPHRSQLEQFDEGLDQLKLKIDRLNARADHVRQRLNQLSN